MSVQSEIDRLNAAKTSLAAAIADQGVEVPGDAGSPASKPAAYQW